MRFKFYLLLFLVSVISAFPQSAKKFFKQGRKDITEKKYESAASNFTKALELKPNNFKYLSERARTYELALEYPDALRDYKSLLNLKSTDEKLLMKIADLSITLQDYAGAVVYLDKITVMDYKNVPAWQKASFAYLKLKKFRNIFIKKL